MIDSITTMNGGKSFTVTRIDGTTENVFVKQLPVRLYPEYLEAQDDEPKMISLGCDKPVDFCDKLTPESHVQLIEFVEKVNGDFFQRWVLRKKTRVERLVPGLLEKPLAKSTLPTTSQKQPSNAA